MQVMLVSGTISKEFVAKVSVYQGSVLSPLLFSMVLEALLCEFRVSTGIIIC